MSRLQQEFTHQQKVDMLNQLLQTIQGEPAPSEFSLAMYFSAFFFNEIPTIDFDNQAEIERILDKCFIFARENGMFNAPEISAAHSHLIAHVKPFDIKPKEIETEYKTVDMIVFDNTTSQPTKVHCEIFGSKSLFSVEEHQKSHRFIEESLNHRLK